MSQVIEIRPGRSKSWLDRSYSRVLSAQLADRLTQRCQGEKGLFFTLTYRRDDYDRASDLYRRSSDDRHVRRFIESLSRYLGESLTGRWLCKLEFQRGGWVHWHIVILGVDYIDHAACQNIWGRGYVWINRITKNRIRYLCKYVAKGDQLPAYLYSEPIRSVKIIRTSPGFWGNTNESSGGGDPLPPELRPSKLSGCYVPIGMSIEQQENSTIVRTEDHDGEYSYQREKLPCWEIVRRMLENGSQLLGTVDGWIRIRVSNMPRCRPARSRRSRAGGAVLHLTNNRKPPIGFRWLDFYFEELFKWQNPSLCEGGV
ncbi:MAG: hypothetical protein JKY43_11795 [Phycisphaerales bacterium]|nr:hypothetical protein [Phycisphaerales bacterium]